VHDVEWRNIQVEFGVVGEPEPATLSLIGLGLLGLGAMKRRRRLPPDETTAAA
jgi:PEP-CTERM motif